MSSEVLAPEAAGLALDDTEGMAHARLSGAWTTINAEHLESYAARMREAAGNDRGLEIDFSGVTMLDTLGANVIDDIKAQLDSDGTKVEISHIDESMQKLLSEVEAHRLPPPKPVVEDHGFFVLLTDIGEQMVRLWKDMVQINVYLGEFVSVCGRVIVGKARLRPAAVVSQIERAGLRGVPIIALITFLVGAIVAQQTIFQLNKFGATLFVVDLLGILMLREVGVLLAAIMVAGRSGSAITAELGSMKMREEIDAMRVMGFDVLEVLILPRILALVIALPLLSFIASMAGLFGGGLVTWLYGGITPITFLDRLQEAISPSTFFVGLIKAPVMALMVGTIACIEGVKVGGSAESLGRQTTNSVVKSIFTVIVVDGMFAMLFAALRL